MVFAHSDYRSILKSALAERIARNPGYSLRSLARKFAISPALLSQITNGKRNLTPANAARISKKLGLEAKEADYFCTLVHYENAKNPEAKSAFLEKVNALSRKRSLHNLSLDAFEVISEWYHFPILQLLRLKKFNFTTKNIGSRLGISILEAEVALNRLERLGILKIAANGKYARVPGSDIRVNSNEKNIALRSFHKQMLQKAIQSLEMQSPQEKYVGSETMSINLKRLPQVKERIDAFLDEMNEFLEKDDELHETYHLGVQFFRLTKQEKP